MHAFSHLDFLAHVSKTSNKAYMLVTVDQDRIDGHRLAVERALSALNGETIDKITMECGAIVVFDDIDDAVTAFYKIERNLFQMPDVDLFLTIFYEGYNQLNICQSHDIRTLMEESQHPQAVM